MIRTLLVAFLQYGGAGSTADADAATFASNCSVMEGRGRSAAKTTPTPPATEELLVYMKEVLALACSSARRSDDGSSSSSVPENDAAAIDAAVAAAIAAAAAVDAGYIASTSLYLRKALPFAQAWGESRDSCVLRDVPRSAESILLHRVLRRVLRRSAVFRAPSDDQHV